MESFGQEEIFALGDILKHIAIFCILPIMVAFVAGIIGGAVGMVFLLSTPVHVPLFTFRTQFLLLQWLSENSRIIVAAALSLLMSFGLISITYNIFDMMNIRARLKGLPLPR